MTLQTIFLLKKFGTSTLSSFLFINDSADYLSFEKVSHLYSHRFPFFPNTNKIVTFLLFISCSFLLVSFFLPTFFLLLLFSTQFFHSFVKSCTYKIFITNPASFHHPTGPLI
uniref:Uncharacterized protein n=1 Tax=Cacopsylla melanoneura TaxID=428564 RepID=A0A8D9BPT2_9HEMI